MISTPPLRSDVTEQGGVSRPWGQWFTAIWKMLTQLPTDNVAVTAGTYYVPAGMKVVYANCTAGTVTIVPNGAMVRVKKTDVSANNVTFAPASGTVDGAASYSFNTVGAWHDFEPNGSNYSVF